MGIKIARHKKRNWTLTLIYRLSKLLFVSNERKFKLFLNLEWIFDRLAHEKSFDYYTVSNHPLRHYSIQYILQLLKPTDVVLDLGCHSGQITTALAAKAKKVVGIDYDEIAIEKAKAENKNANLTFVNDEVKNYLSKNELYFDVLILSHILEHLDNPKQIILDCKKYVNFIYIELPDFDKSYANHYRVDLGCDLVYTDTDHVSEFDRFEIKALVQECGFSLLESEYRFGVQRHWCKKNDE
jgi:SAM-dependent methyltransferase